MRNSDHGKSGIDVSPVCMCRTVMFYRNGFLEKPLACSKVNAYPPGADLHSKHLLNNGFSHETPAGNSCNLYESITRDDVLETHRVGVTRSSSVGSLVQLETDV